VTCGNASTARLRAPRKKCHGGPGQSTPAAREVLGKLSESAIISDWLGKSDQEAFTSIVTEVGTYATDQVDRLDAALLSFATADHNPAVRLRLIKFYAIFKITEMRRYQEFRGFPQ
jgi:hypothetical protein